MVPGRGQDFQRRSDSDSLVGVRLSDSDWNRRGDGTGRPRTTSRRHMSPLPAASSTGGSADPATQPPLPKPGHVAVDIPSAVTPLPVAAPDGAPAAPPPLDPHAAVLIIPTFPAWTPPLEAAPPSRSRARGTSPWTSRRRSPSRPRTPPVTATPHGAAGFRKCRHCRELAIQNWVHL
ncbi:vegetative cell wall protein gp1-like [Setaria italica]|uniref:vegetative cell wall protein gp1-like n=1 Tax=Setaria italica TaxID=4555 RepID=UPI00064616FC|nr:vegetative cell wall protein gp1-like [Setaria italica]